jgi:alpha-L-arabinofuranosidase
MSSTSHSRRTFLKTVAGAAGVLAMPTDSRSQTQTPLVIDPEPRFALSPYLYTQFTEQLGATDGSVDATWDSCRDCWRDAGRPT